VNRVRGPLAAQLGTRPEDFPQKLPRPSILFGVIAGDQWINPAGPIWLPPPHDGTVSVESTRLAGMEDHLVPPYTHTFIMNPAVVANQIDHFFARRSIHVRCRDQASLIRLSSNFVGLVCMEVLSCALLAWPESIE